MIGKRIGRWTVVAFAGHDKNRMRLWLCRCDCGYERVFGTSYLNTGQPKLCVMCRKALRGATEQELLRIYTGAQVGDYTVLRLTGRNKYGSRRWLCRCKCGYEREFLTSYLSGNGRRHATRCRGCVQMALEAANHTVSELPVRFWDRLVAQASRRGISLQVSRDEAAALFQVQGQKCALTGEPIRFTRLHAHLNRYTTASLDRIDSNRPYESGNIQWVHKYVNMMKGSLTQADFIHWCSRVAARVNSQEADDAR